MSAFPAPHPSDDEVRRLPIDDALAELRSELRAGYDAAGPVGAHGTGPRRVGLLAPRWRPWWAVVAAAAVTAALLVVPALLRDDPPAEPAGRPPVTRVGFVPPRPMLEVTLPGWTVDPEVVTSDGETVRFGYRAPDGQGYLTVSWGRDGADGFRGVDLGDARLRFAGTTGSYFGSYGHSEVTARWPGPYTVNIVSEDLRAPLFRKAVRSMRRVETTDFPPEVVRPSESYAASTRAFAGAELPPGFVPRQVVGWNSLSSFYSAVAFQIDCAWLKAYAAGDQAERDAVREALERSDTWPIQQVPYADPGRFDGTLDYIRKGGPPEDAVRGFCG